MKLPLTSTYQNKIIYLSIVAIVVCVILTIIMLQTAVRCINPDGCMRSFCSYSDFKDKYKPMVKQSGDRLQCRNRNF